MTIVLEGIFIIVLIVSGYIAACFYLNDIKWNSPDWSACRLNKLRICYLAFAWLTGAYALYIFYSKHPADVVEQIAELCLIFTLLPAVVTDFRMKKIPNQFLIAALIVRIILYSVEFLKDFQTALLGIKEDLLAAGVIGVFFLLLYFLFKNGIGMGDVKLFALMGLYQGLEGVINSIFFSLAVSFFAAVILLIVKKKKRTDAMPFAPCIFLGTMLALRLTGV